MEDLQKNSFAATIYPKLNQRKKQGFVSKSMMYSPIFDQVDDELLDIFSSISSPLNPLPDFQSPFQNVLDPAPQPATGMEEKSPATVDENDENHNENKKRKIIHRDVERQRRQEMSSLYSSIRSLLPQENLKGKRSVSDHLSETVNYITYLQKKMKGLSEKRDAMKRVSNLSSINTMEQLQKYQQDLVMVRPSWEGGVEIVIDTATAEHGLSLSTLVQVLEEEDLQIVSCVSTKIKDASFYTIESKVNGNSNRDLSELKKRLTNLVLLHLS